MTQYHFPEDMYPNTSTVRLSVLILYVHGDILYKVCQECKLKNNVMKYFYVMVTAVESLSHNMRFGLFNIAASNPCYIASLI